MTDFCLWNLIPFLQEVSSLMNKHFFGYIANYKLPHFDLI